MNSKLVEEIANAVLYEGYMLYPYRPSSVKNRQRWNFGVIYPRAYSESQKGSDNWFTQTECLVSGDSSARLTIKVRFLQAVARTVGELKSPVDDLAIGTGTGSEPDIRLVETLRVGNQLLQTWQEAIEREVIVSAPPLAELQCPRNSQDVSFLGTSEIESVRDSAGLIAGVLIRTTEALATNIYLTAENVADSLYKITLRISNASAGGNSTSTSRDEALMHSLLSAHSILSVEGGEFVSLLDPPDALKEIASGCNNVGTWPVLAGDEGQRDGMLSSPIILYDYPQIAPESPGDLFDGTEIDEILALRILTLTDGEKDEMRGADPRSRRILERTEAMPQEHFAKLHGALRGLRSGTEGKP